MRRLAPLFALLLLAGVAVSVATPTPLAAQAGMPDMSKAPPDVQAIWKKVMSGGIPTKEEAAKLQAYMDQYGGSANGGLAPEEGVKDCPARSPLLAQVSTTAPGAAAAAQLLSQLRSTYLARESADGRSALESIGTSVTDAAKLDWLGAALVVGQYPGAAVVVYADAAARGGPNAQLSWSGLGSALEEAGDDAHAAAAFRRALALGPRNALDVYGLGVAYADLGDLSEGISLLTEATGMAPSFGLAWDALGRSQSCTGAMAMAAASMKKAQEVDWTGHGEDVARGPESDDDQAEAHKPYPEPPGIALLPPPVPPAFPWTFPKPPGSLLRSGGFVEGVLKEANEYNTMLTHLGLSEQAAENAAEESEEAAAAAPAPDAVFVADIAFTNSKEAQAAVDRVDARMSARLSLVQEAYHDKIKAIAQAYAPRYAQAKTCRQRFEVSSQEYLENRAAAAVYIGGMTGVSQEYDKVMRAWFRYANDPSTQVEIDFDRREQVAGMEKDMYTDASLVGSLGVDGDFEDCVHNGQLVPEPGSAKDAPGKPGPCNAKEADAVVVDIYSDCRSFRLTIGLGLKAKFEFNGATKGHHGSLFVGLGAGFGPGPKGFKPLSGFAGMQANWGENGRITTAGLGLKGQASAFGNSFQVDETINGRSSGPAQEGSVSVAVAPMFAGDIKGLSTQW